MLDLDVLSFEALTERAAEVVAHERAEMLWLTHLGAQAETKTVREVMAVLTGKPPTEEKRAETLRSF